METDKVKKAPRASETRAKEAREVVWTPPSSLDAPPAPDGFRHRWIRSESLGFDDQKNISGRLRSGYVLVMASEYKDQGYPVVETVNIQASLELVGCCWPECLTRSPKHVKSFMLKKLRTKTMLSKQIY